MPTWSPAVGVGVGSQARGDPSRTRAEERCSLEICWGGKRRGNAKVSGEQVLLLSPSPRFLDRILRGSTSRGRPVIPSIPLRRDPKALLRGRVQGAVQRGREDPGTWAGLQGLLGAFQPAPLPLSSARSPSSPVPENRPGAPALSKRH